jgi:biopolymer transport protein ExbB
MKARIRRAAFGFALAAAIGLASPSFAQTPTEPSDPAAAGSGEAAPGEAPDAAHVEIPESPAVEAPQARSVDELFELVERGFSRERERNREREERFLRERDRQSEFLADGMATLARAQRRSDELEAAFSTNEEALNQLSAKREERLGDLGELFGVVRQVAGDHQSHLAESLTSSQLGNREELLGRLGRGAGLPTTGDLEQLWVELHREITQQGKVGSYPATVLTTEGSEETREVIRAGVFSAISNGEYLTWDSAIQKLRELPRQPPTRYLSTVSAYEASDAVFATLAIDPSRGSLLSALIDTPSPAERIQQGGPVGYTIIALGIFAVVLGLARWASLAIASRRVMAQRTSDEANLNNPLGRVLSAYEENRDADPEVLELKLDEAVIRESQQLDRYLWLVGVVSVVAPLLGLLGTVTGMIQTFQAITLFGAGDPKMMAGGISEALVTTMLGLVVAAPLVLLHAFLTSSRRRIMKVLSEHSTGLVARRMGHAA